MTCKDCVHYDICPWQDDDEYESIVELSADCYNFKPKSRFVELPCAFGDVIYMLVTRKTHSFEYEFENGKRKMIKQQNQHTFIKRTTFMESNFFKVLDEWGKTVFSSKEQAENALRKGVSDELGVRN